MDLPILLGWVKRLEREMNSVLELLYANRIQILKDPNDQLPHPCLDQPEILVLEMVWVYIHQESIPWKK